jgi:hypothetical protein
MTYIFREATTQDELKTLFQLRYKVYKTQYPDFMPDNELGLDIDYFDTRALHFGIFQADANGFDKPVGYFRIITNEETHFSRSVKELAFDSAPYLLTKINSQPFVQLPIAQYFPSATEHVKLIYDQILSKKEKLWEGGRLCLLPEVDSFRLAKHIIECAITIVCLLNKANALLSCRSSHCVLYQFYGFQEIQNIERQKVAGHESLVMSLSIEQQKNIKDDLKKRLSDMLEEYEETGCLVFFQLSKKIANTLNPATA